MIDKLLNRALRLWLRTQVERVEQLEVNVGGESRQILSGYIPSVFLAASQAVYQGLHFSEVEVLGKNIRFNLAQVLKRQPLRLLEAVRVYTKLRLAQADLQASLESPLLANALTDLLTGFLTAGGKTVSAQFGENCLVIWEEVVIQTDKLTFQGQITDASGKEISILIRAGLELANSNQLRLDPVQIDTSNSDLGVCLSEYLIDLGTEVEIEQLSLTSGQLFLCGGLTVIPE
ncbi:LmeA family phospholipid-binding protein [Oscillatoria salina]|uniref:LmeA family phospholipid-binding protein n=1 Tax=Oscillatoria salina TaxID=331517 RepID=UPI0013BC527F|nr:DUF2993 domain-containing protein [Oscillatoria salina]MBZ8181240.1 DUF2993 domain-containing protein [Oscillatoria salina IIICB1]NET91081.1 DUF2993 domain-containing protein [Kamptonema sp. SIO1D9]